MPPTPALFALLAALVPALAAAAGNTDPHDGHGAMHADGAHAELVEGVVRKIDPVAGQLTISHGALPNGMPAMTMAFKVKEAAWLAQLKVGQKIRFASQSIGGTMTVVRLEAQK